MTHVDGVRDDENPCAVFKQGEARQPDCSGDGHYACQDCERLRYHARNDFRDRLAAIEADLRSDPAGHAAALGVYVEAPR